MERKHALLYSDSRHGGLADTLPQPAPHIRQYFQTIHLIIFVSPYGRYTDESHNSLIHAVQSLHPRTKPFSALMITHCEEFTGEKRQRIIDGFKGSRRSSEVATFIGKEICTVGFPDILKVQSNLKQGYQSGIAEDEKAIRRLVKECTSSLSVQDLAVIPPLGCWESFCACCRGYWESFCACCGRYWETFWDCCRRCWERCRISPFALVCTILCFPFIILLYICYRNDKDN